MNNEILEQELITLFRDNHDQLSDYGEEVMCEEVFVETIMKYLQEKEDSDTADQIFNSRFRNE